MRNVIETFILILVNEDSLTYSAQSDRGAEINPYPANMENMVSS